MVYTGKEYHGLNCSQISVRENQMDKAIVVELYPAKTEVEAGREYHWCRCGRSQNQPFCDGSHRNTDIVPLAFTPEENTTAYLCQCKQTGNQPYCDGSHKKLKRTDKGTALAVATDHIASNKAPKA